VAIATALAAARRWANRRNSADSVQNPSAPSNAAAATTGGLATARQKAAAAASAAKHTGVRAVDAAKHTGVRAVDAAKHTPQVVTAAVTRLRTSTARRRADQPDAIGVAPDAEPVSADTPTEREPENT